MLVIQKKYQSTNEVEDTHIRVSITSEEIFLTSIYFPLITLAITACTFALCSSKEGRSS